MIFILYQKIRTLLKYSYFTKNFVLYQKIRTLDEQVQGHYYNHQSFEWRWAGHI